MFKLIKKKIKKEKGFTLVETLIAISILMISVAAPLSLAAKGIQAANLAKQQITAYYLAQDAYEFVKNTIDTNKLNNKTYAQGGILYGGLNNYCVADNCEIDTLEKVINRYTQGNKLEYSKSENIFGYSGVGQHTYTSDSIYSRYIRIEKINDNAGISLDEIKLTVTVEWKVPFVGDQKYVLVGNITSW